MKKTLLKIKYNIELFFGRIPAEGYLTVTKINNGFLLNNMYFENLEEIEEEAVRHVRSLFK